jgi:MFS family permease
MFYAGSFLIGVANIIVAPCIFLLAGMSVDVLSAGMAISLVSCSQNLGQFASPFVINYFATKLDFRSISFSAFIYAGIIAVILALLTLYSQLRISSRRKPSKGQP